MHTSKWREYNTHGQSRVVKMCIDASAPRTAKEQQKHFNRDDSEPRTATLKYTTERARARAHSQPLLTPHTLQRPKIRPITKRGQLQDSCANHSTRWQRSSHAVGWVLSFDYKVIETRLNLPVLSPPSSGVSLLSLRVRAREWARTLCATKPDGGRSDATRRLSNQVALRWTRSQSAKGKSGLFNIARLIDVVKKCESD